jgi:hypothetical protein
MSRFEVDLLPEERRRLDMPPSSAIIESCHLHELDAVAMMQYEACTNLCRFVKSGMTRLALT